MKKFCPRTASANADEIFLNLREECASGLYEHTCLQKYGARRQVGLALGAVMGVAAAHFLQQHSRNYVAALPKWTVAFPEWICIGDNIHTDGRRLYRGTRDQRCRGITCESISALVAKESLDAPLNYRDLMPDQQQRLLPDLARIRQREEVHAELSIVCARVFLQPQDRAHYKAERAASRAQLRRYWANAYREIDRLKSNRVLPTKLCATIKMACQAYEDTERSSLEASLVLRVQEVRGVSISMFEIVWSYLDGWFLA